MYLLLYYIAIFFSALVYEDLSNIELLRVGGLVVYIADGISILIFLAFCRFLQLRMKPTCRPLKLVCIFLGWIGVAVLLGFTRYGFRAIGEFRTMANYFAFFIPFLLSPSNGENKSDYLLNVFRNTLFVAAAATLLVFVAELIAGGRIFISSRMQEVAGGLEDFRGVRILNSDHAVHLTSLLILVVVSYALKYRRDKELLIAAIILLMIIAYSKNRTAVVALFASFGVWVAVNGYFKLLISIVGGFLLLGGLLYVVSPGTVDNIVLAFGGIFNVSEDQTGQFRLLVQAVAIQQGLQHPFFGEGFGNYFNYYIPQLGITYDVPPHSMYVYLFQKTGIVGTLLAISTVVYLSIWLFKKQKKFGGLDTRKQVYLNLLFVLILAELFYGFAYNFSMFFGLYCGFGIALLCDGPDTSKPTGVRHGQV